MLQTLKNRMAKTEESDKGFTLIELMVVVMIIAVLLAIAIPTFLGTQDKAKARNAQSSLRNTVTAARTIYTDSSDYTKATATALEGVEPSLEFVTADSASPSTVSIDVTGSDAFYAAAKVKDGECFYIKDAKTGTTYHKVGKTATCTGAAAKAADASFKADGWS
jgi:type IV pilus assembly protein PilA